MTSEQTTSRPEMSRRVSSLRDRSADRKAEQRFLRNNLTGLIVLIDGLLRKYGPDAKKPAVLPGVPDELATRFPEQHTS